MLLEAQQEFITAITNNKNKIFSVYVSVMENFQHLAILTESKLAASGPRENG